jgi:CheY-like chemotaxis protein
MINKLLSFARGGVKSCNKDALLIVDDEEQILSIFSYILRDAFPDLHVETACNGAEGVDKFLKKRHSVIVMDLRMPVMDGFAAYETIKQETEERHWEMPSIIFCTGYVAPDGLETIDGFGEQHLLVRKPVTANDLVKIIGDKLAVDPK